MTRGARVPDGTFRSVKLDDNLKIGTSCFIEVSRATAVIEDWLDGSDVQTSAVFSDDFFSP